MASAFTKLFMAGHRKRASLSAKRNDESSNVTLQDAHQQQQQHLQHQQQQSQPSRQKYTGQLQQHQAQQQHVSGSRKSFASARPSLSGSIQEEQTPDDSGRFRRGGFLTTESLNAPSVADELGYEVRNPFGDSQYNRKDWQDGHATVRASTPRSGSTQVHQHNEASSLEHNLSYRTGRPVNDGASAESDSNLVHDYPDDDDDLDSNAIFLRLSEEASLRKDWDAARLVLVPLQRSFLAQELAATSCLEDDNYIALHALEPSRLFKDQYTSVRSVKAVDLGATNNTLAQAERQLAVHEQLGSVWQHYAIIATLLPDQRTVQVSVMNTSPSSSSVPDLRPSPQIQGPRATERKLQIVAETTVYRTISIPEPSDAALLGPNRPSTSSGFEVVSRSNASKAALSRQEKVKIRVISVEGLVVPTSACSAYRRDGGQDVAGPSVVVRSHLQPGTTSLHNVSPSGSIAFPSLEQSQSEAVGGTPTSRDASGSPCHSAAIGHEVDASDSSREELGTRSTGKIERPKLSDDILSLIPARRSFPDDLYLLLSPPDELEVLHRPLAETFDVLSTATLEFASAFVFVKGFEAYNVNRIRRGIWHRAWRTLENGIAGVQTTFEEPTGGSVGLSAEATLRLKEVLENVVMGYVHEKMHGSTSDQFVEADERLDNLLSLYRFAGIGLIELGVHVPTLRHRPGRLEDAIETLRAGLGRHCSEDLNDALSLSDRPTLLRRLEQLNGVHDPDSSFDSDGSSDLARAMAASLDLASPRSKRLERARSSAVKIRTPLETLQALKATIDKIGMAVQRSNLASSRTSLTNMEPPPLLSTDDLLPILAYVIIKAQPTHLASCLHYAKTFKLIDPPPADLSWAFVTFEAVVEYLKGDPLRVRRSHASDGDSGTSRPGGNVSRHGSFGATLMRSLPSRHKVVSGSVAAGSHYHSVSMSRQSSDLRDRRLSMPLTSPDGMCSPTSPMSPSSSGGAPSASNLGYFPRTDQNLLPPDAADDEASPMIPSQEGFKLPGLPASVSGRPIGRPLHRPGSLYTLNGDGASILDHEGITESAQQVTETQPLSRQSSMRNRTISLNAGGGELQIRPQIIRTSRRPTAASASQIDLIETTVQMERTGSSGGYSVRVVGSPVLGSSSPPKASRRKSMDSWSALSFFGSARSPSSEGRGSLDVAAEDQPSLRRVGGSASVRPLSLAESAGSFDNAAPASTSSINLSWLPWSSDIGSSKRPNTPGSSSIVSVEGVVSSSSTFSSLTRSASGSGFASMCAAPTAPAETSPGAGVSVRRNASSSTSRRPPSIRSNSSYSSGQGNDEQLAASSAARLQNAASAQLRVPARKRHRARFLSNAPSSTLSAPSPPTVNREATAGDITKNSERKSLGSLSAVMTSTRSSEYAQQPQPPLTADSASEATIEAVPALHASSSNLARRSSLDTPVPPFFRLHVPSPVKEIADPLTSASVTPTLSSTPYSVPEQSDTDASEAPARKHAPMELDLGLFADLPGGEDRELDLTTLPAFSATATFKRRTGRSAASSAAA